MDAHLLEKAKGIRKQSLNHLRKLKNQLGVHPATLDAQRKADKAKTLTENYTAFYRMVQSGYPNCEQFLREHHENLKNFTESS